jgi:ABC-type cobalamin transport system ATPase subunit
VDQRLVRQHYVQQCDPAALALYLVLVTVADVQGLSYYSDASLERLLRLDHAGLCAARAQLCQQGLVAYEKPLYQVLALQEPAPSTAPRPRAGQCLSLKEALQRVLDQGGQP